MSRPVAFGVTFLLIGGIALLNMRGSLRAAQRIRPDLNPATLAEIYAVLTLASATLGAWLISTLAVDTPPD